MKCVGGKHRIAKYIIPHIIKGRKHGQYYVEPFCGGCNTLIRVDGNRIGSDVNKYRIALLKKAQKGWTPPTSISLEHWTHVRDNKDLYDDYYVGFIGFLCSFMGMFFTSYAKKHPRADYHAIGSRSVVKHKDLLKGIELICCDYRELQIPGNSIIYCDPPYSMTKFKSTNKKSYGMDFDHDEFHKWCFAMSEKGHSVFVSGYENVDGFELIWEKEVQESLSIKEKGRRVEKLFKVTNGA